MNDKPLKAYHVRDGDEGHAVIFATNGATARRHGAQEMDREFSEIESCRRVPAFDQHAPGPVPPLAKIAEGWWFECEGCSRQVDDDTYDDDNEVALTLWWTAIASTAAQPAEAATWPRWRASGKLKPRR